MPASSVLGISRAPEARWLDPTAGDDVGGASRGQRGDETHRLGGPVLRQGGGRNKDRGYRKAGALHACNSLALG